MAAFLDQLIKTLGAGTVMPIRHITEYLPESLLKWAAKQITHITQAY